MTSYVSRYRRILVIGSLVRAWSCVEGRVRNPLLALPFGAAPEQPLLGYSRAVLF
jgi:hypothetical protein